MRAGSSLHLLLFESVGVGMSPCLSTNKAAVLLFLFRPLQVQGCLVLQHQGKCVILGVVEIEHVDLPEPFDFKQDDL